MRLDHAIPAMIMADTLVIANHHLLPEGKNTIILPEQYEPFAGSDEKILLRNFEEKGGSLIPYDYKIDRGSFLYAEDLIKKIMNKKRSV